VLYELQHTKTNERANQTGQQAGSELKVYLFNDAVLVATKKLGKSVCKDLLLLADVTVLETDAALGLLGLRYKSSKGVDACIVLKAGDAAQAAGFRAAMRRETVAAAFAKLSPIA
jgi:sulfur transfer complex TusBCD TusB component (DsrH family)